MTKNVRYLDLSATDRCNARCAYCYSAGARSAQDMSEEVFAAALSWLESNLAPDQKALSVYWLGAGEPALRWDWILEKSAQIKETIGSKVEIVYFGAPTNGSILSDDFVAKAKAFSLRLRLSADQVPDACGMVKGTLQGHVVEQNFERMVAAGWASVRGTLCPANLSDMVAWPARYVELGATSINMDVATNVPWSEADLLAMEAGLDALAPVIRDSFVAGNSVRWWLFVNMLKVVDPDAPKCAKGCSVGRGYYGVDTDGSFIPCHRFAGRREYALGNVFDGFDASGEKAYSLLPGCTDRTCPAWGWCSGFRLCQHGTTGYGDWRKSPLCRWKIKEHEVALRLCEELCGNPTFERLYEKQAEHARTRKGATVSKTKIDATPTPAAKLDIVIPCLNEGKRLIKTVETLGSGDWRVIIVDDAGTDGAPQEAAKRFGATVIRNPKRFGVSRSRNVGLRAATAESVAILDAHMLISGADLAVMAQIADERKAIVQPLNRGYTDDSQFFGGGGRWFPSVDTIFKVKWVTTHPTEAIEERETVLGACYVAPLAIWRRLQGTMDNGGLWGFGEEIISLKAWFAGVPILLSRDHLARHYYYSGETMKDRGFDVPAGESLKSWLAALRIVFGEDAWNDVIWPHMEKEATRAGLADFVHGEALLEEHRQFQAVKKRDDNEFLLPLLPVFAKDYTDTAMALKAEKAKNDKPGGTLVLSNRTGLKRLKHLAMIFFHDFPHALGRTDGLDLFGFALDRTAEVCNGIVAVCYRDTVPTMIEQAAQHHSVLEVWQDPEPHRSPDHFERAIRHLASEGYEPETVFLTTQDQLPPPPDMYALDRAEFLRTDCGHMMIEYLCTWDEVGAVALPKITTHTSAHTVVVRYKPDLSWHPYKGFATPANAGNAFRAKYPLRHMAYHTAELRAERLESKGEYGSRKAWLRANEPMPVVPYYNNPRLTWKEWQEVAEG